MAQDKIKKTKGMKAIMRLIRKNRVITLFGHVNPDCDCYGSSIALRELIRTNFPDKEVYALGTGPDYFYERLARYDEHVPNAVIRGSLAILLDVSELARVSDQRVLLTNKIAKIDHHIESRPFTGVKWVDTDKIAVAQMIAEFAFAYHLKITRLIAEALYLGILTDSGRFRYPPTDASTHRVVARLYEYGIEPPSLFAILYQSDALYVKYQAQLVSTFKMTKNNVIYCFSDVPDYERFGLTFEEVSKNVNVLGNIRGCPIWTLFTRSPEGSIRVEFRSSGLNIQPIAFKYGGGGHATAAGARITSWDTAKKIVSDLDALVEEAKRCGKLS